tara:strand:- start:3231 stop:3518 length:288 start_codon:yes stop_codon:yes gene_type:complete
MTISNIANINSLGFSAALLTTIAFLPQVIKTWRTKTADDISFVMLLLFLSGVVCWIAYGLAIKSTPIVIANSLTFILNSIILFLKLIYKNKIASN